MPCGLFIHLIEKQRVRRLKYWPQRIPSLWEWAGSKECESCRQISNLPQFSTTQCLYKQSLILSLRGIISYRWYGHVMESYMSWQSFQHRKKHIATATILSFHSFSTDCIIMYTSILIIVIRKPKLLQNNIMTFTIMYIYIFFLWLKLDTDNLSASSWSFLHYKHSS